MIGFSIIIFIYVIIAFYVQIFLHEAGHLLFGKLTGYRILAFRLFGIVILRDEKRLSIKRYRWAGASGQCLMLPPQGDNYPFVLNILGGCILNALTAIGTFIIICFNRGLSMVHILELFLFVFYGLAFAAINAIPMKNNGVVNDGQVFLDLLRNSYARECYRKQLELLQDIIKGKTYGEFCYELLQVKPEADLTNSVIGYHKILECYHFMELRNWSRAKDCLECFSEMFEELPKMLQNIVLAEELFIRISMGDSTVKESGIYETIRMYLKRDRGDYNAVRVRIAYEMYSRPSTIDRKKVLKELQELSKYNIYRGEARYCESLIRELLL